MNKFIRDWVNKPSDDEDGWTALHIASGRDTSDFFKYLAQQLGADLKIKTKTGITILHQAAMSGNTYILSFLHEHLE